MRPITDAKGKTRADMTATDRSKFARAKDLALEFFLYEGNTEKGKAAATIVGAVTTVLEEKSDDGSKAGASV